MEGYNKYIENRIEQLSCGEVFDTDMIAKSLCGHFQLSAELARKIVCAKLKRLSDTGVITRVQKGVYYRTQQTVFGAVKPNLSQYAVQSLTKKDGHIIGYETGASYMNRIGLSSSVPKDIEIASNNYHNRSFTKYHISLKKPPTIITDENYRYLQLLDVIEALPSVDREALPVLSSLIRKQELDPLSLIFIARKYYSASTTAKTIDVIMHENPTKNFC